MKLIITLDAIKDAFKKIGTLYAKDGRVKLDCNLILKAIVAAGTDKVQLLIPDKNNNPVVINPEEPLKIAVMPLSMK